MNKHIPGPWQANKSFVWTAGHDPEGAVASVNACWTEEAQKANARLIAAAPDLLEALRIITAIAATLPGTHGLAVDNARAAIAKAEGAK